jgi:DNA-binding NarL/FixJ family response regulator
MDKCDPNPEEIQIPLRIVVADDQPRAREGLIALLTTCQDLEVIGAAENGCQAIQIMDDNPPDIALIDVRMPEMDGLVATRLIKKLYPNIRVVLISIHSNHRTDAFEAGADDFLIKGCPPEKLLESILGNSPTTRGDDQAD